MIKVINIKTSEKIELLDVTNKIQSAIKETKILNGLCALFIPHATAALLINENEPGLIEDFKKTLKLLGNAGQFSGKFLHNQIDNNAAAHIISGLLGTSICLIIEKKALILGPWQKIFFVELDGPREDRKIIVKTIKEK